MLTLFAANGRGETREREFFESKSVIVSVKAVGSIDEGMFNSEMSDSSGSTYLTLIVS